MKKEVNTPFGEFFRTNSLKQKELAEFLGVAEATVSSYVHGKSDPLPDKMQMIIDNDAWDTTMLETMWFGDGSEQVKRSWDTFRREAAMHILSGMLSETRGLFYDVLVENAVKYADALIEELKKKKK